MHNILLIAIPNLIISYYLLNKAYLYLNKKEILDSPNVRSLHTSPKVRGGGIAILITYILFVTILYFTGYIKQIAFLPIIFSGFLLGTTGWLDDKNELSIKIRFPVQIISAIVTLFLLYGFNTITIFKEYYHLGLFGNILAILFIVWMINLYNFMDGIDGLAITEAIIPAIFLVLIFWNTKNSEISYISLTLILSLIPFYKYNWPPSKMFMGDVLSGFLGFFFAFVAIYINNFTDYSIWIIIILLSGFIFDSTFTLIKRIINKKKFWEAHSSHFYQQFAKVYGHKNVTIFFIILNFILFIPAYSVIRLPEYDFFIVILTYSSLLLLTIILKKIFLTN